MNTIATLLRALQLYAHNAHNLAKGPNFFSDHEYLGELYGAYEGAYDSIVERMIGEGDEDPNLGEIGLKAATIIKDKTIGSNDQAFSVLLSTEEKLRAEIEKEVPNASLGTQNLLQQLADDSLSRCYKLKQRLE
jgi:DNA-binding ferritin-like protein